MKRYFVDSNVFLRYYSNDDKEQSEEAAAFFLKVKNGEIEIFCGPPVFFEVAWVLKAYYKLPNSAILDILESMLSIPNFTVFDIEYVTEAIELARKNLCGFADSYISAAARDKGIGVATFNGRHFQKHGIPVYDFEKF
jgi:predicted nucleic-acid-binding protein